MASRAPAKLSRPRLFNAVPRERLFRQLDACVQRPITFVVGAPGAGKSTLLASYIAARDIATLWYRVDPGDEDIASFFYFLKEAGERLVRQRPPLPLLTPEYLADLDGFAQRFFRALLRRLPDPCLLVFDNLHTVGADAALHRALQVAIAEMPEGPSMVCLSRSEAPATYAAAFANDLAVRLDEATLKLTEDETRALILGKHGLDEGAAAVLVQRTEGWAAGVSLLAQQWTREGAAGVRHHLVTVQGVGDYFRTEIMQHLRTEEAQALMRCALLPTVSAASSPRMSDHEGAPELLERLYRRSLFTEKQNTGEVRFRFHDLFREFLVDSLREQMSEASWRQVLATAGHAALSIGEPEAAIPLLLEAGDGAAAATAVNAQARPLLGSGRFRTLHDWLARMGEEAVDAHPWLRFWFGHTLMATDLCSARKCFERAYVLFVAAGDVNGQLMSAAQIINTHYYGYMDYAPMAPWAERIDRLMAAGAVCTNRADEADIHIAMLFATTWLGQGDHRWITERAERMLLDPLLEVNQRVSLGYALSDFYTLGSRMSDARRVMARVPMEAESGVTALNRIYAHLQFGYQHLRAGEYEQALGAWEAADRVAAENGLVQTRFLSCVFRSFLHSCKLEVTQAEQQLKGLEVEATDGQPLSAALYHVARVLLEIARLDGRAASHHARLSLRHATRLGGGFISVAWRAHGSAALAMAGEHAEAERWIDEGLALARGGWLECYRTNLLMSRAYSLLLRGERERAHQVIAQLLELARDNDWWTYLRIVSVVKDTVVREAVRARIDLPFALKLVRALHVRPDAEAPEDWPWPVRLYVLGSFSLLREGAPVEFPRKAQKRPLALLKAILAFGGQGVDGTALAHALWPDAEADDAQDSLTMAIHRLRKLLGDDNSILVREGKCSLNCEVVWTDVGALERLLAAIDSQPADGSALEAQLRALQHLYRGHFLEHEAQEAWLLPTQQRLRARVQRAILRLGMALESAGDWAGAVTLYQRGIELDALAEPLYCRLMQCHHELGQAAQVVQVYLQLRKMLSAILASTPSPETDALYSSYSRLEGIR
jgi:LuxR family transcriptional regulator, maltose regulon positive regulatory protein